MMRPPCALASLLLFGTLIAPAWALSDPTASPKDGMDRSVAYDQHNRVQLTIQKSGLAVITFDPNETIEQVIKTSEAPFTYACEVVKPEDKQSCDQSYINNLPLIGKAEGPAADLIVLTRGAAPNDRERTYIFSITVASCCDALFTKHLTFTYGAADRPTPTATPSPDNEPRPKPLSAKEKKAKEEDAKMIFAMQSTPTLGAQNDTPYFMMGRDRNIAPVWITDNYSSTGFQYPGNMPQPSVFKVLDGQQGTPPVCHGGRATGLDAPEQSVNSSVRGDFLVVQETWHHWRLRSGDAVVDAWNCHYDPIGNKTGTGTESPDIVRRVIR